MRSCASTVSSATTSSRSADMPMKPLAGLFLAYGDPDLGVTTTRLILGACLPGTLVALVLAIRINRPA